MIKVKGLKESEIVAIAEKVAKNHRHKIFGNYTQDDIHQEIWLIILDRLSEFDISKGTSSDPKKALEHFLNSVVSKRLINLYRDKFLVPQRYKSDNPNRSGTAHMPTEINDDVEKKYVGSFDWDSMDQDLLEFVISYLTKSDIKILEAIMNGESISPYYRSKLSKHVKAIIKIYGKREE